jgi:small-conductance mechanosensitive channel
MKKQASHKICLAAGLILFFFLTLPGARAQNPPTQEPPRVGIEDLEKTIRLLENPKEAKKLASQLRTLVEAEKELRGKERPQGEEQGPGEEAPFLGLEKLYGLYEEWFLAAVNEVLSGIREFVLGLRQFKDYISREGNFQEMKSIAIQLLVSLLAGLGVWILLRTLTRRRGKKWGAGEPAGWGDKMRRAWLAIFSGIYPWVGVGIVFLLFSWSFRLQESLETILFRGILAIILLLVLKKILFFLLSPESRALRVLPLREESSGFVYIWARRILLFSFWTYILYMPCSVLQSTALKAGISIFFRAGLGILGAVILAQLKGPIRRHLHLALREGDPPWKSSGKKFFNFFSANVYLVGVILVAAAVVLSVSGFSKAYAFFLSSTKKSLLILVLAVGLWHLWKFLFRKLFEISQTLREKFPDLAEQADRYLNYLRVAGFSLILLFAGVTILDAWGARIYAFLAASMGWVKFLVRIPAILLFGFLLIQVGSFLVKKFGQQAKLRMLASSTVTPVELDKRISTLTGIIRKALLVVVWSFVAVSILSELGFDIKPLLAGAGIMGLAVGFGAQNLVRDVISGLFFIFENRIRVGDVAILNGTGGLVEQVNLRTMVLRGLDGTVHVFPNGAINTLSNMTYEFSYYPLDVGVAYKEDTDRVVAVLREVGDQMMQEDAYRSAILEPLEILGVDKFDDSAVVIKARIKTLPIKQWLIGREMNRRIKKRFDELGIEIPFPHRSLYFGEASKPISVKLEGLQDRKEEIKAWVREVLQERREDR